MKYINQLEHRDIPYEHNLDHGGVPEEKRNVAAAGCGPSCLCMMVDALTLSTYELTDCLKLSNEVGANREIGTSLKILMEDIISSLYRPTTMRRVFWIRPIKKENMRSRAGMEKREPWMALFTAA